MTADFLTQQFFGRAAKWARLQAEFLQLNIAAKQRLQQQLAEIADWFEYTIVVSGIRSAIGFQLSPR